MEGCFHYLQAVAEAQAARQTGQGASFNIVIRNRKIYCVPKKHITPADFVVSSVSEFQCVHGLTANEWKKIEEILGKALKENRL